MFDDVLSKIRRRKKSNCLTVVRNNCQVFDKHVIIKRRKQNVYKGINVRERTGLIFFTRTR